MVTPAIHDVTVRTAPPARSSGSLPRRLLSLVVGEMQRGWHGGAGRHVEFFLGQHPQLGNHPDTVLRLVYEEVDLRKQRGEDVTLAELERRFPQYQAALAPLLARFAPPPAYQPPHLPHMFCNFELIEELGHGGEGHVYLGRQLDLANRPVVLKITKAAGVEHLSLARLQHTHIVPLYDVFEEKAQGQRALCMPYFGRATLKHVLEKLAPTPCAQRTGRDVLEALDKIDGDEVPGRDSPNRIFLAEATYVQALCWMGACLADALHYAHERGLVHFDVKPSNILLAADGQPMLLDFHLARPPMNAGDASCPAFGGTPLYMAPEQQVVGEDIVQQRPISTRVDARVDIFSLGMVLYQALSGKTTDVTPAGTEDLRRMNPAVSVGLGDVVQKCLAWNPGNRYATAEALATDLRCHVNDKPLRGVRNRSWGERWQKWRRRRPYALCLWLLGIALGGTMAVATHLTLERKSQHYRLAEEFFFKGRDLVGQRQFAAAKDNLTRGLELAETAGDARLLHALDEQLRLAERALQAEKLHQLADALRLHMLFPTGDQRTLLVLDVGCAQVWGQRTLLLDRKGPLLEPLLEQRLQRDLGDLAIGWAGVRVALSPPAQTATRQREALALLSEAAGFGTFVPAQEWARYGDPEQDIVDKGKIPAAPRTAWEHAALGRCLLQVGELTRAAVELEKSVGMEPVDFHANFCLGVCASRLERPRQAITAFSVCIGQEPLRSEAFIQRGRAHAAWNDWELAFNDFDRALRIRPNVPGVLLERAKALIQLRRYDDAGKDIDQILQILPGHEEALRLSAQLQERRKDPTNP
jgi:serine/threonine protein kinase/tetratricopeptide (TPR) repeat protein